MNDKPKPATIEQYIGTFPEDVQKLLKELHQKIHAMIPEAEEAISYGIPMFKNKENGKYIVYFSAWKQHISVYPIPHGPKLQNELEPYVAGKGTLQFPLDKPLPYDLIKKVVDELAQENLERTGY